MDAYDWIDTIIDTGADVEDGHFAPESDIAEKKANAPE